MDFNQHGAYLFRMAAQRTRNRSKRHSGQSLVSIVDDDESMRAALASLLRSMAMPVATFASAEDFLNSSHSRDTSCLVLDVRMPGMNGLELQLNLAQAPHPIPIIFITAHADDDMREQALNEGAVCFLSKPFSDDALLAALHAAFERDTAT